MQRIQIFFECEKTRARTRQHWWFIFKYFTQILDKVSWTLSRKVQLTGHRNGFLTFYGFIINKDKDFLINDQRARSATGVSETNTSWTSVSDARRRHWDWSHLPETIKRVSEPGPISLQSRSKQVQRTADSETRAIHCTTIPPTNHTLYTHRFKELPHNWRQHPQTAPTPPSMCVCVFVCEGVCTNVSVCMCLWECVRGCISVCVSVRECVCECLRVFLWVCLCVCVCVCVCVSLCVCAWVCLRVSLCVSVCVRECVCLWVSVWVCVEFLRVTHSDHLDFVLCQSMKLKLMEVQTWGRTALRLQHTATVPPEPPTSSMCSDQVLQIINRLQLNRHQCSLQRSAFKMSIKQLLKKELNIFICVFEDSFIGTMSESEQSEEMGIF